MKKRRKFVIVSSIAVLEFLIILFGSFYLLSDNAIQKPAVLVIDIEGEIVSTQFGGIFDKRGINRTGIYTSSKNVVRMLEFFDDDPNIQAFILAIDSNGGQGAAEEEIVRQIQRTNKPVISVVKGNALSAGYFVAAGTDRIFAGKQSNIADIGVVTVHVNRMRDGEEQECKISSTEYKRMYYDDCIGFESEIIEKLQHYVEVNHELLVYDIADMRGLPISHVQELADGTIFLGSEALELGLIDEIGNTADAVAWFETELDKELETLYLREMMDI